jgi:hypothetical protein
MRAINKEVAVGASPSPGGMGGLKRGRTAAAAALGETQTKDPAALGLATGVVGQ